MRKNIKKIYRIALGLFLTAILVPVIASALLLIPQVQTKVAQYVAQQLSQTYQTTISVEEVYFTPLGHLLLKDVLIKDLHADSLLYIKEINGSMSHFSYAKRQLEFRKLEFISPTIHIKSDTLKHYNFDFLISPDTTQQSKGDWKIQTHSVGIKDGTFSWFKSDTTHLLPKIDLNQLKFKHLNLTCQNINISKDSTTLNIHNLSFIEQSGFEIDTCQLALKVTPLELAVTNLKISNKQSFIKADTLVYQPDTSQHTINRVFNSHFKAVIDSSKISPSDLQYFSAWANNLNAPLSLSGNFYGSIPNLNGKDVTLSFGQQSVLQANFNLVGLPKYEDTFLFFDITNLSTQTADINLLLSGISFLNFNGLPDSFNQLGVIQYKGNFTGFINDLVAYGKFKTNLGNINTDLEIKTNDELVFSGSLKTTNFKIGHLAGAQDIMGQITMKMEINGHYASREDYSAYLKGTIDSMKVRNYNYQNITLNGLLANRKFDGQVEIADPAGFIDFTGSIDYSQLIPNYNFFARVRNLKLDRLIQQKELKNSSLSMDIISNFEGNNINDITGFIRTDAISIEKNRMVYKIDSIVVSAMHQTDGKLLTLRSDLLNGSIHGKYNFTHIAKASQQFLSNYLPATMQLPENEPSTTDNDFTFHFELKELGKLMHFLNPDVEMSEFGFVEGRFNDYKKQLLLDSEIERLRINNLDMTNIITHINSSDKLQSTISFDNVAISNMLNLGNLTIQQSASNNNLITNILWNNWAEKTNSGAIFSSTAFTRQNNELVTAISLQPSQIVVTDTVWNIKPTVFTIDANGFQVDNFRIWHGNQQISVDGRVDKRGNDGLNGYIRNLNLAQILRNVKLGETEIAGIMNGEFLAKDLYINPNIIGELTVDNLSLNKAILGKFEATSEWNATQKALILNTQLADATTQKMKGTCIYTIDNKNVDLSAKINKVDIRFLEPWLDAVMQNVRGKASGNIFLNGPISNPILTARVNLENGKFDVDYLKTSYFVSDSVFLEPQRIVFQNMTLQDKYRNKGVFKGYIAHNQFSNLSYNLQIDFNNMLALDTKAKDNDLYFGTVFASGSMKLTGVTSLIKIDVAGKTMPNTVFSIPIQDQSDAASNDFIQFVSKHPEKHVDINETENLSVTGIEMNMNIEATPDAHVQIIFDQRSGEILKGTGSGDLQLKIDKFGNLSLFGNYIFEDGDYLFTLQSVINKRFTINRGSTLKWDGDPYNANINISATYDKCRASLYDLMGSSFTSSSESSELKKRIPIYCNLFLKDRLLNPTIQFGIEVPSANQSSNQLIKEYIRTEEEMNRQVLSLLVLNRFYSPELQKDNQNSTRDNTALNTTTEMLSNQLSNWLSQISNDVDVNIKYRPSNEITSQEIEVALSTQLFNDRVSLAGNVGYEEYQTSSKTNSFIGDVDVNVKLNEKGNIRAHAYTHSNNDIIYSSTSPTKQGVGISFREEFNTWDELMQKYLSIIRGDNKKKKKSDKKASAN